MSRATMHAKTDSEVTSNMDIASSPPRPLYYVQSPSNHDAEKMSYASSPLASPPHNMHYYHCSPINHSRESSTSRFSAPLKGNGVYNVAAWKNIPSGREEEGSEECQDGDEVKIGRNARMYMCFGVLFMVLFGVFALALWGSSRAFSPKITVKNMVFENFNIQSGIDGSGVQTDMLNLNSTVRILYRNPAIFFGVHVTSTPFQLFYYDLRLASGEMKKFYQSRKSQRTFTTVVVANQVPLYGVLPVHIRTAEQVRALQLPLNLTFVVRSRAFILGRLVRSKFYSTVHCSTTFRGTKLGKPLNMTNSCI